MRIENVKLIYMRELKENRSDADQATPIANTKKLSIFSSVETVSFVFKILNTTTSIIQVTSRRRNHFNKSQIFFSNRLLNAREHGETK